jgi:O-antigen ligase
MGIVNYILFFILTIIGIYYLFVQKQIRLKSAIHKDNYFLVDNFQYLLLFILSTAILAGGNIMANRLLVTIILSFFAIVLTKQSLPFSITGLFYIVYLLWLVIAIFYSPVKLYGFRIFLKYLYPFLIMLFASKVTHSTVFYRKALQVVLYLALYGVFYYLILTRLPLLYSIVAAITFWGPAIIDFLVVPIAIGLTLYAYSGEKKYLIYVVLFVIPAVLAAVRTGILAASITIVVFAIVKYKLKSLPYVILGCALLVGTVLYVPAVRDKMFVKQLSTEEIIERGDDISQDDIQSNGRYAMWKWALTTFYQGKEWTGSGLGILQKTLYSNDTPFSGVMAIHNDYVQILCDSGLVGLILYGLTFLSLIVHSFYVFFSKKYMLVVKIASLIAGVSMAGMISTLYTDNVVNYSLMTLSYPFALYGMMLGLMKKYQNSL